MKVQFIADHEFTDASILEATGHSRQEWYDEIARTHADGRRNTMMRLMDAYGLKDVWWPTTIWVEYEREHGIVGKDKMGEAYTICATKTIRATADRLYASFTDATQAGWLGSDTTAAENGVYHDDGGNLGEWLRLRPGKDIRIRWQTALSPNVSMVDITFAEKGDGKTLITVTHSRIQTREEADGLRRAWGDALTQLKQESEATSV